MSNIIKGLLKQIVKVWPWPLTLNEKYDRETHKVISRLCRHDSVCIDVGSYEGEILRLMMKYAPDARHAAFEPIPQQYFQLRQKLGDKADIYPFALGKEENVSTFQHVISNPTYSGLKKRNYKGKEKISEIKVQVRPLDEVIAFDLPIHLIKIDVEGGEYDVLQGARRILEKWKPYLIFEHGIGAADKYGVSPLNLHQFLVQELGYTICLMEDFLKNEKVNGFTSAEFEDQFWKGKNCYFLAFSKDK
jgi:FkbM family methyltransferase